ncbi:MAG: polysaccharide deacetylase family protein [Candidatus Aenigmarchaeota archaeon]|nr:polysaccharide deacetylase family protein [Candidatus Aenigmarchaeota archaeon]
MTNVCFYFQVHQPFRLRKYSLFDIGTSTDYFDEQRNRSIMQRVAQKCYLPANKLLLELISKYNGKFKASFSITGTALEQFEQYAPRVLDSFKALADTGCVEFLSETYHHSLASLYNKEEFIQQVELHYKAVRKHFGARPLVFRNTELCFNNQIAALAEKMGYKAILAEGADHILGWRSPNFVYKPKGTSRIKLLLKNYRLSDDIAFRFSDRKWEGWPVNAQKFASWLAPIYGDTINLFIDYETFGEHQWDDTGIFNFLKHLPAELFKKGIGFHVPSQIEAEPKDELDFHNTVSWADMERDTSAWTGNKMQQSAIENLYALRDAVLASKDEALITSWRKLTTSDHFYYMCTKWFSDGDVHKYFNPYESPYDAFISFMNVLNDIIHKLRIEKQLKTQSVLQNQWIRV